MAKNVNIKLGADITDFQSKMKRAQGVFKSAASSLKKTGASLTKNLTAPLLAIGAAAIKGAADLEKLEASFVSLTGGTKQAAAMMKQLTDFTAKTPFQIDAVAKSARQLIASGTEVNQVNDQLQFLGDIAATSGSSIDDIAAIFSKVQSKGKVELESLNQLAERGIPIFKALSEKTGLLPSKLGAGAVSVEQFNEVLGSFNKEGGFAEGAMNRLSQTMAGKVSTALDNLKLAGADLVQSLLPLIHKFLEGITRLAQKFTSLSSETKTTILRIGLLVAAIGPLLIIIGKLVATFGLVSSAITIIVTAFKTMSLAAIKAWATAAAPVVAVIAGIAAVAAAVMYVVDNMEAFKERFSDVGWWKNALIQMLQWFIEYNTFSLIIKGFNEVLAYFKKDPIGNPFEELADGLEALKVETNEYENEFGSFKDTIVNGATKAKDAIADLASSLGLGSGGSGGSGGGSEDGGGNEGDDSEGSNSGIAWLFGGDQGETQTYLEYLDTFAGKLETLKYAAKDFGLAMVKDFAGSFASAVVSGKGFIKSMGEIFKDLAKQIAAMIIKAALLAAVFAMIPGLGATQAAMGGATDFLGLLSGSLTGKASGGSVIAGQPYMVGEQGAEMFIPGQSGTIIPNNNLGGGHITGQFVVQGTDLVAAINNQLESDYGASAQKL
jgi:tape measure domain-containing protein